MPYKSESIPLHGLQDRRRKLTDEQRKEICDLYETGKYSSRQLADVFGVSKRTILIIVNPNCAETARAYRKAHWKEFQHSREERTTAAREHRRYKQSLYLQGLLVADEKGEE